MMLKQWDNTDEARWGHCSLLLKDGSFCGIDISLSIYIDTS